MLNKLLNDNTFFKITKIHTALWILLVFGYSTYLLLTVSLGIGIVFMLVQGYLVYFYLLDQYKTYQHYEKQNRLKEKVFK